MTAEIINDLFEEGITRSRELSDAADEAMKAVDEMAAEAEALAQRLHDEGNEACQHLRDLTTRLEQAEAELETGRGEAEHALLGLSDKADALKTAAGDVQERVKKSLDEVESRTSGIDDSLDALMSSAQDEFEELAQKTQDAETAAEQRLQEAATAVAALRTLIDNARAELAQKQGDWSTAAEELQTAAHEQAEIWVASLNDQLARQAAAMVQAANFMVDEHNEAMAGLKRRFIEEAPQELGTALEPVVTALDRLGHDATEHGQSLTTSAQQLEQWAGHAKPIVDAVKDALESAGALD